MGASGQSPWGLESLRAPLHWECLKKQKGSLGTPHKEVKGGPF